jgi:hypothetical protein
MNGMADYMKATCENCRHFEPKGITSGSNNWGLCIRSKTINTNHNMESPFFRWEDDTCSYFKAKEALKTLLNITKQTG